MTVNKRAAKASEESLLRIFTIPVAPDSTLGRIENEMSQNLAGFLGAHIAATEQALSEIEKDFADSQIPEEPAFVSDHMQHLLDKLVSQSVHTSSPSFIGHMTSALPYFILPLSKLMVGLNQNLVKIETSKAFTPMERQVLGMMHRLVYQDEAPFYQQWMHSANHSLGAFCSGGTVANLTALWVARNNLLKPDGDFKGVAREGLFKALKHYQYDGLAILVSARGHYSLKKSADVLGIGQDSVIAIPTDENNKIDCQLLAAKCQQLASENIHVLSIVGVAGTTETGNVDPLDKMAAIAQRYSAHFHVDAAWGGATLLSNKYRPLLKGIELADSVTIDAHKQMYVPMGAGLVVFKNPASVAAIEHHAEYILRKGSKDLGSHTLEGSRPGMAMLVYSALHVISRPGYEMLINHSIEKAHHFAELIAQHPDFELITKPELCLLTYRYNPAIVQKLLAHADDVEQENINELLDKLTKFIQKRQRENGKSFVSRTRIEVKKYQGRKTLVFRVVLANPLTSKAILQDVLAEQTTLAQESESFLPLLLAMT
ncbi:putative pyridoxal-dependent aspartate 1-decarboxylase [Colwellia sp. MB02u-18]|uniref:pyridoxal-dependent aspartate 1-decarboxylase PanP n=1 Tax=unclassified Colwellia TaxID=196834 RepID=UPI0015F4CB57|nr:MULTISPECIES: putative pyridoxal-dependent aspartate 1-decarboxylase [unclassified Colwellia]MBA6224638.1 putative pyridoxal-dependent aspartate 1-decarboxylase [Colwellia sp. MB3u-45]MBA6268050.1 putative pyridoxal-dependent aspartate 1-decarboxylase [Colwellia sp. MB3u-43]MBA6322502.1 putative pyridoxal-dependent aspartate 1-decarboxylase [Colwellia sp. MB02u-19]MBA6326080.1 putative pyridoxal-dependent aspartate 1-decarboxylase [Colwellia sp. MB02u-18]MBA6331539.1 putative pyridoxal-depe